MLPLYILVLDILALITGNFLFFYFRIELSSSDARWVGAWWIGFLISSFCGFSIALVMGCFARELPGKSVWYFAFSREVNAVKTDIEIVRLLKYSLKRS